MAIIETRKLNFIYGKSTPMELTAVRDVSVSIEAGEFLGVIGHTGSGKSTLIQMLNGLIRPTSGQVLLNGKDIWAEPKKIREVRFQVGMVFQYPEYQLFEETALKDIMFGPMNMGLSKDDAEYRAHEAAKFAGIKEHLLQKSPFEISGGEKRRVAIAGVIAMDPEVLILDEPTAGLDPRGRDVLLTQIRRYHEERKNTVILISHSMEDIGRVADRILVMNRSRVAMFGDIKSVFSRVEDLEEMGIRVPQITKIMKELKELGLPVDAEVHTLDAALRQLIPILSAQNDAPSILKPTEMGGETHDE